MMMPQLPANQQAPNAFAGMGPRPVDPIARQWPGQPPMQGPIASPQPVGPMQPVGGPLPFQGGQPPIAQPMPQPINGIPNQPPAWGGQPPRAMPIPQMPNNFAQMMQRPPYMQQ
jgi:hypothetical protein